jgi:hypothetical protein
MAIRPARAQNNTNLNIPYQQNPKLFDMPNVARTASAEVIRLQLAVINDIKTLMDYNYEDFKSIDYVTDAFYGNPQGPGTQYYKDKFREILSEVHGLLSFGDQSSPYYDFLVYRNMFNVRYNKDTGAPIITFTLDVQNNNIDDLDIQVLKISTKDQVLYQEGIEIVE